MGTASHAGAQGPSPASHGNKWLQSAPSSHELFLRVLSLLSTSYMHGLAFLWLLCWRQHQLGGGGSLSTVFLLRIFSVWKKGYSLLHAKQQQHRGRLSGPIKSNDVSAEKKYVFVFFQLEQTERYLFFFFLFFPTLFCQSKTKRFAYQTIFVSEHLFNLPQNILFCVRLTRNKREWRNSCTSISASFFQKSQWPGHSWEPNSKLRSQLCLKGFEFASPSKWASHCTMPFSHLTAGVSVFIKTSFRAVNIEGSTHWDFYFTLMVKAVCWGERIIV